MNHEIRFEKLEIGNKQSVQEMSKLATSIVREHFDPLIGEAQNDYMISLFQTVDAISEQLNKGYQYYFVMDGQETVGFLAFYPKESFCYLSKFYLYKDFRGQGISKQMLDFVIENAREKQLESVQLNVNRNNMAVTVYKSLGFSIIREEKNDIGNGFFMDDYVMEKKI